MSTAQKPRALPAPMLWPAVFWASGLVLGRQFDLSWQIPLVIALALLLAAIPLKNIRTPLILLCLLLLGFLYPKLQHQHQSPLAEALAQKGSLRREVSFRVIRPLSDHSYEVDLLSLAGRPVSERILLLEDSPLHAGISYQSVAEINRAMRDPIMDLGDARFPGIMKLLWDADAISSKEDMDLRSRIEFFIRNRLNPLPEEDAALASALLLSDPSHRKVKQELLSRSGMSHLVVVSGLHVLILYFILITILRFFLPSRLADLAFIVLICGFAALNHWAAPISRSILMISLAILAKWLSRPLSALQNLSISLFVITLLRPAELFGIGLQLSFLAVLIITVFLTKVRPSIMDSFLKRNAYLLLNYILLSLVVGISILPLTLYYFGTASLNGILANLLGLPIVAVLLALALCIIAFPFEGFYLSYSYIAELWQRWLEFCASLPLALQDHWLSLNQSIALGLLIILLLMILKGRWHSVKRLGLALCLLAALLFFMPIKHRNQVIIFNAGTADCSLIFAENGQSIMIDSGGLSGQRAETSLGESEDIYQNSWLRKRLISPLKRMQLKELDYLLITHLHSDHAAGIPALFRHLNIHNLILSRQAYNSADWQKLSREIDPTKTRIITVKDTFSIAYGSQRLKILHPDANYHDLDENNASIVCRFDSGTARYLFTGDIEAPAEAYLCRHYPQELKAEYLKVPHHGSRGSSSKDFLDAVDPRVAWICCSKNNVHGFPHPESLRRMRLKAMQIVYTYDGSIRYSLDD